MNYGNGLTGLNLKEMLSSCRAARKVTVMLMWNTAADIYGFALLRDLCVSVCVCRKTTYHWSYVNSPQCICHFVYICSQQYLISYSGFGPVTDCVIIKGEFLMCKRASYSNYTLLFQLWRNANGIGIVSVILLIAESESIKYTYP